MRERQGRIAGAGLLALDVVVCVDGEPDAMAVAGGTCGNVLSVLSYLNWHSSVVGYLGEDSAGSIVADDLKRSGVYSRHLKRRGDTQTPVFVQHLTSDASGRPLHTFISKCPQCGEKLKPKGTHSTPIRKFPTSECPDVFFMDRLSEDILALAESAKAHGAMVYYEPSAKDDAALWEEAFKMVDIVKYSADRFTAEELEPYTSAAKSLWEVQTLGEKGLRYRRHVVKKAVEGWKTSKAISAPRVVDTCGAGDWCSAGLLYDLIAQGEKRVTDEGFAHAIRFGQVLAAWACAFVGARGAMYANTPGETWNALNQIAEGRPVDMKIWPATRTTRADSRKLSYCGTAICAQPK